MVLNVSVASIVSILEVIGFVVATVLQALGYGNDAVITALSSAVMHSVIHVPSRAVTAAPATPPTTTTP